MLVYTLSTIITVVLCVVFSKIKTRYRFVRIILCLIPSIPLILISGFRYGVGQDYFYTYVPYFEGMLRGKTNPDIEIGFEMLTRFIMLFSADYFYLFLFSAIIFFIFSFLAIFELSPYPSLSVFLLITAGYFFSFLNTMRQMIAVSIVLYSIKYIKKQSFIPFAILIALATMFHTSTLVFLPAFLLYRFKIKPFYLLLFIGLSLALATVISPILKQIVSQTRYGSYIDGVFDTKEKGLFSILIGASVFVFSIFVFWMYRPKDRMTHFFLFLMLLKAISVVISFYDGELPLLSRVRTYYDYSTIILIPLSIYYVKGQGKRIAIGSAVSIMYTTYIFYILIVQNANNVLPYKTIFER